jgi:hypothetical protein
MLLGEPTNDGEEAEWTSRVFDLPLGRYLVGAVGLGFIASGLHIAYCAVRADFKELLERQEMSRTALALTRWIGRIGHLSRAVVFGIIGMLLARAALDHDPEEAGGMAEAFQEIFVQPFGPVLLAAISLGFIALGIYYTIFARYRVIG